MPESRDDLDTWLSGQVRPLMPPPGTFELVRKQARRRKMKRAALSAVAVAAVVAVGATLPQVLVSQLNTSRDAQSALISRGQTPTGRASSSGNTPASSYATGTLPVSTAPVLPPVPTPFSPSSVTMAGTQTGWVIGQAGTPGYCATQYCTSIARTDDAGKTWYGVKAPLTGPPDGSHGVGQLRFLGVSDGWAFGPELWATHDGGRNWTRIPTRGLRVTALEARGNRVYATWANCTGTGADFAAHCTNFVVYSALATSNRWAVLPHTSPGLSLAGSDSAASLALTGTTGYLLPPDGTLFSGPISGSGSWDPTTGASAPKPVPCNPGPAQPDGQPSLALLAPTGPQPDLALLCAQAPSGTTQAKTLFYSPDGGLTWHQGATVPDAGVAMSLSGSPDGALVLATSRGIETAATVTSAWQPAAGSMPAGGFSFVGMTDANQGVAVPADVSQHAVWFTYNGGLDWRRSTVR
jgi:hypothetical protein